MVRSVMLQTKNRLCTKGAGATLTILLFLVLGNYLKNVIVYKGMDVSLMYDYKKIILPSYNNVYDNAVFLVLLRLVFPILAILPAGFSFINDEKTGRLAYLISRMGRKRYLTELFLSSYLATVAVFLIPMLLDIFITLTSFPNSAKCDLSNYGIYSAEYASMISNYHFAGIFLKNPTVYMLIELVRFCSFSGIISVFALALSYCISFKLRFLLFFPMYLLINGAAYLDYLFGKQTFSFDIYHYIFLFDDESKKWCYYYLYLLILFSAGTLFVLLGNKKRRLQIDT